MFVLELDTFCHLEICEWPGWALQNLAMQGSETEIRAACINGGL